MFKKLKQSFYIFTDRTMEFAESTVEAYEKMENSDHSENKWKSIGGFYALIKRAAIGIMLCLGPFNYPFNETYATLIPALLLGNIVILKLPTIGGLAHILTIDAFAKSLPPGTINFMSGSGRTTVGPMMKTGKIDILAFIGGSKAADDILRNHPAPHRLTTYLGLEAKNLGLVLPDADLEAIMSEVVKGALTYNGQRCTALKLLMVHRSIASKFITKLVNSVNALKCGLPWEAGVSITPLPEPDKIVYLQGLIDDAIAKGAKVVNAAEGGGQVFGLIMKPAIVYPVTSDMRLWHEEQFGPVVPVARFSDEQEVKDYIVHMPYGQQAAVFTNSASTVASFVDTLSTIVGRININTQCGRSPDVFPFSGRRNSALGTLSVTEAVNAFSIETVIAFKHSAAVEALVRESEAFSAFLAPLK